MTPANTPKDQEELKAQREKFRLENMRLLALNSELSKKSESNNEKTEVNMMFKVSDCIVFACFTDRSDYSDTKLRLRNSQDRGRAPLVHKRHPDLNPDPLSKVSLTFTTPSQQLRHPLTRAVRQLHLKRCIYRQKHTHTKMGAPTRPVKVGIAMVWTGRASSLIFRRLK